jgi:hypothetical protein
MSDHALLRAGVSALGEACAIRDAKARCRFSPTTHGKKQMSGHDFSRAVKSQNVRGFSPCRPSPQGLKARIKGSHAARFRFANPGLKPWTGSCPPRKLDILCKAASGSSCIGVQGGSCCRRSRCAAPEARREVSPGRKAWVRGTSLAEPRRGGTIWEVGLVMPRLRRWDFSLSLSHRATNRRPPNGAAGSAGGLTSRRASGAVPWLMPGISIAQSLCFMEPSRNAGVERVDSGLPIENVFSPPTAVLP